MAMASNALKKIMKVGVWVCLCLSSMAMIQAQEEQQPEFDSDELQWKPATATWYGSPDGDGSDGGACGYGKLVDVKPLKARVGAASPVLFRGGQGCGVCYKIKCTEQALCSRRPVTVVITDECPGGFCADGHAHFDLSGAAFARMALAHKSPILLNSGQIPVLFRRTKCEYPGKEISFRVNQGSTDYWLSILIEFEDGDGDVGSVDLKQQQNKKNGGWLKMRHLWGANWCAQAQEEALQGPFSIRVTTLSGKATVSARNVIPANWHTNATYTSRLNFD